MLIECLMFMGQSIPKTRKSIEIEVSCKIVGRSDMLKLEIR